jgi:hypothetical protein
VCGVSGVLWQPAAALLIAAVKGVDVQDTHSLVCVCVGGKGEGGSQQQLITSDSTLTCRVWPSMSVELAPSVARAAYEHSPIGRAGSWPFIFCFYFC